jgi:hypothetical protein
MRPILILSLVMLPAAACRDAAAPEHPRVGHAGLASLAVAPTTSLIDGLGAVGPTTRFSVFGSGGTSIVDYQLPGPAFVLTEPTTITQIGGFLNNCKSIVAGIPQCPGTLPFTVQVRPARNGLPDASTVLASFTLSHDDDPLIVSYESVATDLTLRPGSYFALFAPQGDDEGIVLGTAGDPFTYRADQITAGFLNPHTGDASVQTPYMAARILGSPATPQAAIQLLGDDIHALVTQGALGAAQANGLLGILDAAGARLDGDNTVAACAQLAAFERRVNGLMGNGKLTPGDGQSLIDSAEWIRARVGCD